MKVYLAGKIAKNDWRHNLVPMLRYGFSDGDVAEWAQNWPPTPMYRKDFQYIGPFFISCDHGCTHGEGTHGAGEGCYSGKQNYFTHGIGERRWACWSSCISAISYCDVLFAWLDYPCTAHGTLTEIGTAFAMGKTIIIGSTARHDDLWFIYLQASQGGRVIIESNAESAFRLWADTIIPPDEQREKCESPLELAFWDAYLCRKPPELNGLVAQYPVAVANRNYRLDFALPNIKIAFEVDGFSYHGDKEAFNRDRRRDLDLKLAGWKVHRFDGDLVRDDTPKVIQIAAELTKQ